MNALGFIETRGFVAATEAADSALKAASVSLVGKKMAGSGLVMIVMTGDVAAVKAAVEAGASSAASVGEVVAAQVIARPHEAMERFLGEGSSRQGAKSAAKQSSKNQERPGV